MSRSYSPSTQEVIGDIVNGLMVETASLEASTYIHQNTTTIFNVYGRIRIKALFGEIMEVLSNNAATLKYQFTSTTPAISAADLCTASGSLAQAAQGLRVTLPGANVATAAAITASAGISYTPTGDMIVGTDDGVGYITIVTAAADMSDGNIKFFIYYVPMSDGAYVTAAL